MFELSSWLQKILRLRIGWEEFVVRAQIALSLAGQTMKIAGAALWIAAVLLLGGFLLGVRMERLSSGAVPIESPPPPAVREEQASL